MTGTRRIKVGAVGDVEEGQGRVVTAEGLTLALFNVRGAYYVIDNTCGHRGGPLGEGDLDGTVVTCPWHAWRWDVTTGQNADNPGVRVSCYPVTVTGGEIFVDLP